MNTANIDEQTKLTACNCECCCKNQQCNCNTACQSEQTTCACNNCICVTNKSCCG